MFVNYRRILSRIALVAGALLFSVGLQASAAFAPPAAAPPGANAYAPLSTGPGTQTKVGDICTEAGGGKCLSTAGGVGPGGAGDGSTPVGAIMFFNQATCPAGWNEVLAARGRTLVGWDSTKSGSLGVSVGVALGDKEDRATGQHYHSVSDPGHAHSYTSFYDAFNNRGGSGTNLIPQGGTTGSAYTGINVGGVSDGAIAGTNAPYLQLLVCQNGGTPSSVASPVQLYNSRHSSSQCIAQGGELVSDGAGNSFCKFAGNSCPAGWNAYGNWTQTSPGTSPYNVGTPASLTCGGSSASCTYTSTACTTSSHGFANVVPESLTCSSNASGNYTYNTQQCSWTQVYVVNPAYPSLFYLSSSWGYGPQYNNYCNPASWVDSGYGSGYYTQCDPSCSGGMVNVPVCAPYSCSASSVTANAVVTNRGCY